MATFGPAIEIKVNATAYVNALGQIAKPKLDSIVALALSDVAKGARVKAAAVIARRTGLKSATVKAKIFYDRVNPGDYEVAIKSSKKALPLIEFPVTQVAAGVRTRAWGKVQVIRHAFIATVKSGHRGVYRRKTANRLPLEQLWGPTIGGTFATPEVQGVISQTMMDRLQSSLSRRMAAAVRRQSLH
jgi:hypothetical protein